MGTTGAAGKTGIVLAMICIALGWICHMLLESRRRSRAAVPYRAGGDSLALHHQRKGA
jgi:cysteine synthase